MTFLIHQGPCDKEQPLPQFGQGASLGQPLQPR